MFDHIRKKKGVSEIFKDYDLKERDVTFIRELIKGSPLKATTNEV